MRARPRRERRQARDRARAAERWIACERPRSAPVKEGRHEGHVVAERPRRARRKGARVHGRRGDEDDAAWRESRPGGAVPRGGGAGDAWRRANDGLVGHVGRERQLEDDDHRGARLRHRHLGRCNRADHRLHRDPGEHRRSRESGEHRRTPPGRSNRRAEPRAPEARHDDGDAAGGERTGARHEHRQDAAAGGQRGEYNPHLRAHERCGQSTVRQPALASPRIGKDGAERFARRADSQDRQKPRREANEPGDRHERAAIAPGRRERLACHGAGCQKRSAACHGTSADQGLVAGRQSQSERDDRPRRAFASEHERQDDEHRARHQSPTAVPSICHGAATSGVTAAIEATKKRSRRASAHAPRSRRART